MSAFDAEAFGLALYTFRWQKRMSLRDAADYAGLSFNTLYRMERAIHDVSVSHAATAARWAGLSLDEFVRDTEGTT